MKTFNLTLKQVQFHDYDIEAETMESAVNKLQKMVQDGLADVTPDDHGYMLIIDSDDREQMEIANF